MIQQEDPDFKPNKMIGGVLDAVKDKFLENPKITKQEAEDIVVNTYREMKK